MSQFVNVDHVLLTIDILCLGLVFGSTVFFFFVQSPNLMQFLGREKFVTIQMKITAWFFAYIQIPLLVSLAIAFRQGGLNLISSGIAMAGGVTNYLFIVPKVIDIFCKSCVSSDH